MSGTDKPEPATDPDTPATPPGPESGDNAQHPVDVGTQEDAAKEHSEKGGYS